MNNEKKTRFINARFIEVDEKDSLVGIRYCFDTLTNKTVFATTSVDDNYYTMLVAAPIMFQTLEFLALNMSRLEKELLQNFGVDASERIDQLIAAVTDCQTIATDGLLETSRRNANENKRTP